MRSCSSSLRTVLHSRVPLGGRIYPTYARQSQRDISPNLKEGKDSENLREGMDLSYIYSSIIRVDEKWDEDVSLPKADSRTFVLFPEYGNKPPGLEPTRFGDWQYKGRSTDF